MGGATSAESTATDRSTTTGDSIPQVDPRAPRFGQAITAMLTLGGVVLGEPQLVFAAAAILVVAVLSRWRFDLYGLLWRGLVLRFVDGPTRTEAATPHRFAKLMGAIGTTVATVLLAADAVLVDLPGLALVGYAVAAAVGVLAALGALTGFCLGCRLYGQVAFFRRLDVL